MLCNMLALSQQQQSTARYGRAVELPYLLDASGAVLGAAALLDGHAAVGGTANQVLNCSVLAGLADTLLLHGGCQVHDLVHCTAQGAHTQTYGIECLLNANNASTWVNMHMQRPMGHWLVAGPT